MNNSQIFDLQKAVTETFVCNMCQHSFPSRSTFSTHCKDIHLIELKPEQEATGSTTTPKRGRGRPRLPDPSKSVLSSTHNQPEVGQGTEIHLQEANADKPFLNIKTKLSNKGTKNHKPDVKITSSNLNDWESKSERSQEKSVQPDNSVLKSRRAMEVSKTSNGRYSAANEIPAAKKCFSFRLSIHQSEQDIGESKNDIMISKKRKNPAEDLQSSSSEPQPKRNCHDSRANVVAEYDVNDTIALRSAPTITNASSCSEKLEYVCPVMGCEQSFTKRNQYRFKNHLEIHEGLKPFVCPYCNFGYESDIKLIEHVTIQHTKDQSFECDQCSQKYSTKRFLVAHIKKYH